MSPAPAGYSGTPLAKKLGIKEGSSVVVVAAPAGYRGLLEPLPAGVRFERRLSKSTDVLHLFVTRKSDLEKSLADARTKLLPTGAVWVSWPKKAARLPTDITEDTIRLVCLPMGFVDIKVCAVDEIWSGLKLVIRKELR